METVFVCFVYFRLLLSMSEIFTLGSCLPMHFVSLTFKSAKYRIENQIFAGDIQNQPENGWIMENWNGINLHEWWIVPWSELAFYSSKTLEKKEERVSEPWTIKLKTRNRTKKIIEFNANNSFQITYKLEAKRCSSVLCAFLYSWNHFEQSTKQLHNSFCNKSQ